MSDIFKTLAWTLFTLVLVVSAIGVQPQRPPAENQATSTSVNERLGRFEKQVDELRALLSIPGMSAVIIKDQKVLWAKGFGLADLENRIPATPETLYHIASLTKTFAATLIMQLVEQGKLDLDEPMSHYSKDFKDDSVKVKHLLTHTSESAKPGDRYNYSGNRFDYLTAVIEKKTGKNFREVMVQTFLDPLTMSDSVPGYDVADEADKWGTLLGKDNFNRYLKILPRQAQPYTLYGDSELVHVPYPPKFFGAAAGLVSTVLDVAKFDTAIDRHTYLKKETQERAWINFVSNSGKPLPHGLGWFVTDHRGLKVIWHYGHWGKGFSAIYVKVPEKNLSLIMLANSEALADHQFQGENNVDDDKTILNNVFACNFLRLFVSEDAKGHSLSDPHWTQSKQEFSSEIAHLSKQIKDYTYDCERNSQAALAKWRQERRAQARIAIEVDPKILEAYVGQYELPAPVNQVLNISREGSRLFVNIPKNQKSELFAESESKFFLKIRAVQIRFVRAEGQITHIEFVQNGETLRAKKIK